MSRRRQKAAPPEADERWLATYGDMVTLLMAFFVMLFAMSEVKQEKFEAFISGLGHFDNAGSDVIAVGKEPTQLAPPITEAPKETEVEIDPDPGAGPGQLPPELESLGQQLLAAVAAAGHPGAIEISTDERGLNVSIQTDRVLFQTGSAIVTPQGAEIIAAVAPPLAGVSNDIYLEGHADTTPLNRGGYTNWNLSTDRAVAVVNFLVERHGIAPHRLTASGFGEFQPRDPGTGPEAKARNRRVELIVAHELP